MDSTLSGGYREIRSAYLSKPEVNLSMNSQSGPSSFTMTQDIPRARGTSVLGRGLTCLPSNAVGVLLGSTTLSPSTLAKRPHPSGQSL